MQDDVRVADTRTVESKVANTATEATTLELARARFSLILPCVISFSGIDNFALRVPNAGEVRSIAFAAVRPRLQTAAENDVRSGGKV